MSLESLYGSLRTKGSKLRGPNHFLNPADLESILSEHAWRSYETDLEARSISKTIFPMAPCRKMPHTRSQRKNGRIDQCLEARRLRLQLYRRVSFTSSHSLQAG